MFSIKKSVCVDKYETVYRRKCIWFIFNPCHPDWRCRYMHTWTCCIHSFTGPSHFIEAFDVKVSFNLLGIFFSRGTCKCLWGFRWRIFIENINYNKLDFLTFFMTVMNWNVHFFNQETVLYACSVMEVAAWAATSENWRTFVHRCLFVRKDDESTRCWCERTIEDDLYFVLEI